MAKKLDLRFSHLKLRRRVYLVSAKVFSFLQMIIKGCDLLHCDVGIVYLGLCTDMQLQAYVCRIGEDGAPAGLQEAFRRANRVADIFMAEFKPGRSGNDIVDSAMKKATADRQIFSLLNESASSLGLYDGGRDKED